MRLAIVALACAMLPAQSQKYAGPRPPKRDVPYLLHANKLVELDSGTAREDQKKDDTVYSVSGASAQARTPMPEPIFLIATEKLKADSLTMWRFTAKGGSRELVMSKKRRKDSSQIRVTATSLGGGLYKVEAQEFCESGEYCLTPEGSNQIFCFTVY